VWVALSDATPEELAQMKDEFNLHPLAVEDAHHGHQRPKVEEYGDSLFVVMHLVEPSTEGGHALNVGEVDVFVGKNYVLSVRNRSQQGFLGVRERCEREPELLRNGAGFVLYALMDAVVDRYFPVIDALEVELESIEQQIFTQGGAARDKIKQLYDLKRRSMILKRAVAPLTEAAGKLHGGRVPQICVSSQEYFRDVADHLVRINGSIDAMRDTIGTAISVNLSMVTIEESEVTKRLAAWASIFAVCTAFAGIWGMNFEHMPELKLRYGYAAALALMGGTCSYLYYRFRRAGWL
jgi:magnesium transporter